MKHVRESLNQYYDYKFFSNMKLYEENDEKADLKSKEQDGLAVIEKLKKNFEDFKKDAKGEILKYKEFWEENKQTKEGFTESGDVYKLFDSDYIVGVLELPVETLSDGSIDGGMGATDEPEEEIIEGKVLEAEGEEEDLDLDLDAPAKGSPEGSPEESPAEEMPAEEPVPDEEAPADIPAEEPMIGDMPGEEKASLTEPQKYFVVYDISGDEREEILRCGSNNVVNAFTAFYNDTFKAAMKNIILQYKAQKEQQKKEAEKTEKKKVETEKDSKLKKFLGESKQKLNESSELHFEDSAEAAEYVKDHFKEITGFDELRGDPHNPDMMHPKIYDAINSWIKNNKENIEEFDEEDIWNEFIDWEDLVNNPYYDLYDGPHHYEDEDEDYSDELSDYEWEVGRFITSKLEDEDIEYDEDNLGDALRDKGEFLLQCMKDNMEPMDCAVELMSDEEFMAELVIDDDIDESKNENLKKSNNLTESRYDDDDGEDYEEMHWTERSRRDDTSNEEEAERFNSMLALVGNIPEDIVDDVLDDVFKVLESKYSEDLVNYFADKIQMDQRIWYDDEDDRMYFNDFWSGDNGSAALDDVMEMLSKYEDEE